MFGMGLEEFSSAAETHQVLSCGEVEVISKGSGVTIILALSSAAAAA